MWINPATPIDYEEPITVTIAPDRFLMDERVTHNRAYALLVSQLSSEQRSELERTGKFQVFTGHGLARRRFWIENTARTTFTVHGWFLRYCLISSDRSLPFEDETLLRKLLLEVSPNTFFKNSNWDFRPWVYNAYLVVAAIGSAACLVGVGMLIWRYYI